MSNRQMERVMDAVTAAQQSVRTALQIGNDIEFDRVDVTSISEMRVNLHAAMAELKRAIEQAEAVGASELVGA